MLVLHAQPKKTKSDSTLVKWPWRKMVYFNLGSQSKEKSLNIMQFVDFGCFEAFE